MEHRKRINDNLVRWIRHKVETEFAGDISLVCVYGSWLNGTANALSDVDCYFVPRTDKGYGLARTFILDGVGYDIYPMGWQRLEEIASLESGMQPLVGDVLVLWQNSGEDLQRLHCLQATLSKNLQDGHRTHLAAQARCRRAAGILAGASADRGRMAAGYAMTLLAEALALSRGEYFRFGMKRQYDDLCRLFPGPVSQLYGEIARAQDGPSALDVAGQLMDLTREILGIPPFSPTPEAPEDPPVGAVNAPALAELYQEIRSTFNKIYLWCESGNYVPAFLSAVVLQGELDFSRSLGLPEIDLLGYYNFRYPEEFSLHIRKAEETLRNFIISHGTHIREYSNFETFEAAQASCSGGTP